MLETSSPGGRDFVHIDDLAAYPDAMRGAVVAIGNFDGVHRGHQAVLDTALEIGHGEGRPVVAMTFEPHPRTLFKPDAPVFRLTPAEEKAEVMQALGLDGVVVVPFDREFAARAADDFVDHVLVDALGMAHAVTGYDFHFGRGREGSPAFLMQAGEARGFGVTVVPPFKDEGTETVSSSRIRQALEAGDVVTANALLGYHWFIRGSIRHGDKRGRELGFPTANMALAPDCRLRHGIYAVTLKADGVVHKGVASHGRRPMFDDGMALFETFLFDFDGDLYGRPVEVALFGYLRDERKFDGIDALVAQMRRDAEEARAILALGTAVVAVLDLAIGLIVKARARG